MGPSHGSRLTAGTHSREAQRRGLPRRNEGEGRVAVTVAVRAGQGSGAGTASDTRGEGKVEGAAR